jgi:hypothetical protein
MPQGSELSYRDATGMTLMTETAAPVAKPVPRLRSRKPATVSASALAEHLDCSRAYIGKLEAEGVIQRQGDGFAFDQSRVAYLRYLRRERQQSPRSEVDADHVKVKTEMLQLRLIEKKRELVKMDEVNAMIDDMMGVVLTALSSAVRRVAIWNPACQFACARKTDLHRRLILSQTLAGSGRRW